MKCEFRARALRVIENAFNGEHHVGAIKWKDGSCSFCVGDRELSTFDFPRLTRLVVSCHDECVRGEISNGGPCRIKITLSNRISPPCVDPSVTSHPSLEKHVEAIRSGNPRAYQNLFDEMRAK